MNICLLFLKQQIIRIYYLFTYTEGANCGVMCEEVLFIGIISVKLTEFYNCLTAKLRCILSHFCPFQEQSWSISLTFNLA